MSETQANTVDAFAADSGVTPPVVDAAPATTVTATPLTSETPSSKFYTEEDLVRVRTQEKDKLYSQLDKYKSELDALRQERDAEAAAKQAEEEAKAAAERAKAEAEMDTRDLLEQRANELKAELERERQERERAFALLEREKQYSEFSAFKQQRLEAERENIAPELLGLVRGETPEEINASLDELKNISASILESTQQALQSARRDMKGTGITAPPAGPLDTNSAQQNFTAADIASMSMNEYANYRARLLSPQAQGRGQGLLN
jgi:flagellar biosynthesis GTPase FlhF